MRKKNDLREKIVVTYLRHNSEFQMHFGTGKIQTMFELSGEKQKKGESFNIQKSFYEGNNSKVEFVKMLNYVMKCCDPSNVTIIIWSVFDFTVYDCWTIMSNFNVVSIVENANELKDYYRMSQNFIDQEAMSLKSDLN